MPQKQPPARTTFCKPPAGEVSSTAGAGITTAGSAARALNANHDTDSSAANAKVLANLLRVMLVRVMAGFLRAPDAPDVILKSKKTTRANHTFRSRGSRRPHDIVCCRRLRRQPP